jgi:hypothetical protein
VHFLEDSMDWLCLWIHDADIRRWETRPYSAAVENSPRVGDKRDNHERVVGHEPPGPPLENGVGRFLADAILRFDVFPPRLLSSVLRRSPVEVGDTIGLRYPFVPGVDLFFAARVIARFDESNDRQWRCGFTYRTLAGHPACGEETFVVEKDLMSGEVKVALRSWSRPGILIARLTYPVLRFLQVGAARAALDHLESMATEPLREGEAPAEPHLMRRNLRTRLFWSSVWN